MEMDDAVEDLVALSSYTDAPLQPDRVEAYVRRMVDLIRSDPETLAEVGDDLIHTVVFHAYRYEPCYDHLSDYCHGKLPEVITVESANAYLRDWDEAHAPHVAQREIERRDTSSRLAD